MAGLTILGPISGQRLETLSGLLEEWCGYARLRNGILGFPAPFPCLRLSFISYSALWNAYPELVPQAGHTPLGRSGRAPMPQVVQQG